MQFTSRTTNYVLRNIFSAKLIILHVLFYAQVHINYRLSTKLLFGFVGPNLLTIHMFVILFDMCNEINIIFSKSLVMMSKTSK